MFGFFVLQEKPFLVFAKMGIRLMKIFSLTRMVLLSHSTINFKMRNNGQCECKDMNLKKQVEWLIVRGIKSSKNQPAPVCIQQAYKCKCLQLEEHNGICRTLDTKDRQQGKKKTCVGSYRHYNMF